MGYTYNWELTGLKKSNTDFLTNVIIGTQWKVTATDEDGNSASFTGATPFKAAEVNVDNFVEYESLTEVEVLTWVKNHVSGSNPSTNYWPHIMERIGKQIDETKYNITSVNAELFPWSTGSISGSVTPDPSTYPSTL